jgi:hypothetical protein
MSKIVFVCSPLKGDMDKNIGIATDICRTLALDDILPIAPHLYFPKFLMEESAGERSIGIQYGLRLLRFCDEIWVFAFDGVTEGMKAEMEEAERLEKKIRFFYRWPTDILKDGRSLKNDKL